MKTTCDNDWIGLCFFVNWGFIPGSDVLFNIYLANNSNCCGSCSGINRKRQLDFKTKWEGIIL
ncbi:MAG TPA: hypothetical protein VFK40_14810 [Nitrososphaeraceae archaeon]|nr:hypothetical protein [Nitrososphaeraceae archaeon]